MLVDQHLAATFHLADMSQGRYRVRLPRIVAPGSSVDVTIEVGQPTSPHSRHINGDIRNLGFWLSALSLG